MKSIFETDERLRTLAQTNSIINGAWHMAIRHGDDMEALIVAVQILVQTNDVMNNTLQRYAESNMPVISVDAQAVAVFLADQKENP